MGMVNTEITLKNAWDEGNVRAGIIRPEEVRTVTVTAVADTGSMNLVIPEELCQQLGLHFKEEKIANMANGQRVPCKVMEGVEVHWKNRSSLVKAVVIPGARQVLLGAIPLEDMDLMVNPVTQEVVGAHGEDQVTYIYSAA